jgi:hypothetical protein
MGQTFRVERVTVWKTSVRYPKELVGLDPTKRELSSMSVHTLDLDEFWLVPLSPTERSNFTVSVQQVLPVELWNRGNHQLIWTTEMLTDAQNLDLEVPLTVGVARIHLVGADETSADKNGILKPAVLGFGLCRSPVHHHNKEYNGGHRLIMPWCHLVKNEDVACLEQHLTSQVSTQDAQARASLLLDSNTVLRAAAVRTIVSGTWYNLIKLWVTNEVIEEDGTVVSDPGVAQIEVPELGQDVH